ncbi:MAG: hypothetical protein Q9174_006288 [Haloplaca sp. 1 TL-2023]
MRVLTRPIHFLFAVSAVITLCNAATLVPRRKEWTGCSAPETVPAENPSAPDWIRTNKDFYKEKMSKCLEELADDSYAGASCNFTELGRPEQYGFWKGERHFGGEGEALLCYRFCSDCLQRGIDNLQGDTVKCHYGQYVFDTPPAREFECHMGFNNCDTDDCSG